jgi:hypothetical protein
MRVELYDVPANRLIRRMDCPHERELSSWGSMIGEDGRQVWIQDSTPGFMLHDVFGDEPSRLVPEPMYRSPNRNWYAESGFADAMLGKMPIQMLRTGPMDRPWLQFSNGDLDGMGRASFSPNSRYVAWVGPGHNVTIIDLTALEPKVRDFARSLVE